MNPSEAKRRAVVSVDAAGRSILGYEFLAALGKG